MEPAETLRMNLSVLRPKKSLATSSAGMIGRPEYIAIKRNAVFMSPE